MPRRKITIDEAFAALDAAGIRVQRVPKSHDLSEDEQIALHTVKADLDYTQYPPVPKESAVLRRLGPHMLKITLYAAHTVGSGGVEVHDEQGKHIESAGVITYGPGVCTVPVELAQHLLHQDALARQADENMLDRTQKSYLVVGKRGPGQQVNVGMRVNDAVLGNLGVLPDIWMHFVR